MTSHTPARRRPLSALRKGGVALVASTTLWLGSGTASAVETTFVGYTNGCFGLACQPVGINSPQSVTLLPGLTYLNSTFNAMTSGGFLSLGNFASASNFNNLGSFSLSGTAGNYFGKDFDLLVTFTAPLGTAPNPQLFTDKISGSVTSNNVGGAFIDFDNSPKHFTFANGGSFDFFINDVSVTAGDTIAVSGTIIASVAAVPEPETYALFMGGLAAMGFMARLRQGMGKPKAASLKLPL